MICFLHRNVKAGLETTCYQYINSKGDLIAQVGVAKTRHAIKNSGSFFIGKVKSVVPPVLMVVTGIEDYWMAVNQRTPKGRKFGEYVRWILRIHDDIGASERVERA